MSDTILNTSDLSENNLEHNGLRIIKTARTEDEANDAVWKGFLPLFKQVKPSPEIGFKAAIFQHKGTKEVIFCTDTKWSLLRTHRRYERITDLAHHYRDHFKYPFAAYLIPEDIKVGEKVFLEDLIEDYPVYYFSQGPERLESCEATWNGKDFDIQGYGEDAEDLADSEDTGN